MDIKVNGYSQAFVEKKFCVSFNKALYNNRFTKNLYYVVYLVTRQLNIKP